MYNKDELSRSLEVLRNGGLILYPTDTIWGIGCDATNEEAVKRIYNLKKRSDNKSMLVLLENPNQLSSYIREVPEVAWELIEVADRPLTIIYPGAKNLADNLTGEENTIGIRIVDEPFCRELIRRFRKPLVSTSANISGDVSPATFMDISKEIIEGVDYVVKWRQDDARPATPSSIIKLGTGGQITLIR